MRANIEQIRDRVRRGLPQCVKDAIAVLVENGFTAFAQAKLEDVYELDTGKRQPTFRNAGRYDLVIAMRTVEASDPDADSPEQKKPEAPKLKAISKMNVAELLVEAAAYPEIKGEHQMKKADLKLAVAKARKARKEQLVAK